MKPEVGSWYRNGEDLFQIVAIDEGDGILEIQHVDGDIEDMDFEDWNDAVEDGTVKLANDPDEEDTELDDEEYVEEGDGE